ncbi:MAG: S26 family signal peptidase [Planctomycetota bacterium]
MNESPHNTSEPDEGAETNTADQAAQPVRVERRRKPRPKEPTADETVKETIESIVIAFILAFVFRAFVVEPFIIPTGSMAPTMLGTHAQIACPSCGYHFDVGVDQGSLGSESLVPITSADCPMCNYEVTTKLGTKARSGDRILVDKFSYHFGGPSRWDVVVFKAPQAQQVNGVPAPRSNFIKRLIGLPGERVVMLDGNIFVAPAGTNDFSIARKTDARENNHWEKVQRAVWQPIYHSQYIPIEDGRAEGPGRDRLHRWRVPWVVESGETGAWDIGTDRRPSRVYRFAGGAGSIRFKMAGAYGTLQYNSQQSKYPYNQVAGSTNPIEDIRLAAAFTPRTSNALLKLSTTARLDRPGHGAETLAAILSTTGALQLVAIDAEGNQRKLVDSVLTEPLRQNIATEIELWFVDDEASIWIDGKQVLVYRIDLSWQEIAKRQPQERSPEVRLSVESDGPIELRRVELDRDVYYDPSGYTTDGFSRAQAKRVDGQLEIGDDPLELREQSSTHDAELFCVGDNQPGSKDGRDWSGVNAWIQERYLDGDRRLGVVPRSLLVGRAFMVYYPAPHGFSPQGKGVLPDFGRMRFVH